jgi:hemerythrin-like domain-containing protein
VLIENVEHHVDEEEEDLFPTVRSSTDAEWRRELGERLEAEETDLGAPPLGERMALSKTELVEKARRQQIPGRSGMDHDELAATVSPK